MPATAIRTLTVRIPETLMKRAAALSAEKQKSMNAFIGDALARVVEEEEERAFFDSYNNLGDEDSAEYAIYAIAEVVLADE